MKTSQPLHEIDISRRQFIKSSGLAVAAASLGPLPGSAESGGSLRVGLVGCGGRGTGAAAQALNADKNVKLVAMGDAFEARLEGSLKTLQTQDIASKLEVPKENRFVGFDAYKEVIKRVDVVLLTTPPHFRPIHIKAAVDAGKHIFAEKPVAVDAPGVRAVMAACQEAKRKNISVLSGLCLRYAPPYREMVKRIHAGDIGEIRSMQANDFRGPIWVKPRQPGWTDMEYQMHNWYYFTWLSGDFNVEQHIHMLDLCTWVMKNEYPVSAVGTGGRQVRTGPDYGNIYDHHSVIYEYANGPKLFATCRQQAGCANDISATIVGSRGTAYFSSRGSYIHTDKRERFGGESENMYQLEHNELFEGIRKNELVNNGDYMSRSTLMAILGRMATYTGQKVTWDDAMNSQEDLSPSSYAWDGRPPVSEVAIPGTTKLV
ncbi:MAG TPA: Gfo/Idh/MocA family oxidoreductase [Verrucomicrobiae bacterium]|nr:Gfo/Idh/MocA family oxidoreductase [Verrucomicrobiae bacterium]